LIAVNATRRELLIHGLRFGVAAPLFRRLGRGREGSREDSVLVVLQLSGGNDGLNTLVPHRQDAYHRLRPSLSLAREKLHALDGDQGLHPELRGLAELFAEGRLAVIHGVGYPRQDRSHFRSLEIWHTADPDHPARGPGWLGRLADRIAEKEQGSMPALFIGDEDVPLALHGKDGLATVLRQEDGLRLRELAGLEPWRRDLLEASGGSADLGFLRSSAKRAYQAAERLSALSQSSPGVSYPDQPLSAKLRLLAQLVAGGFDTRIFLLTQGGYDTHARQAATHSALLNELSGGLCAFQRDLEARGVAGRVLTLVYSEFGRRAAENASRGTDHGAAAPVFLLGSRVKAGMHGTAPDLERLVDGDVPYTLDFRAIYSTLEQRWMGCSPSTAVPGLELLD
jgi:uncharacterized protein (DUF1501 family)